MKCENCGRNEATFYYKSNVNGKVTQLHLCQECAEKMGLTSSMRRSMSPMRIFGDDDFFTRPFSLLEPFFGGFGSRLLTEFPEPVDITQQARQTAAQPESTGKPLMDESESADLKNQRRRNALQNQMKAAIEAENFEEAARLRDELKQLPQQ